MAWIRSRKKQSGGTTKSVSYLKWKITKVRGNPPANGCLQIGEFHIFQGNTLYIWNSNVSITTNMAGVSNEDIDKLIDGNTGTKYNTQQWGNTQINECIIVISLGETITFDKNTTYTFVTANDEPSRDPVSWVLYGSTDGIDWEELDSEDDVNIPNGRYVETFIKGFTMGSLS